MARHKKSASRKPSNVPTKIILNGKRMVVHGSNKAKKSTTLSSIIHSSDLNSRRYSRPGVVALQEIRQYQKSTQHLIPRAPFHRLIREITESFKSNFRYQVGALVALQKLVEEIATSQKAAKGEFELWEQMFKHLNNVQDFIQARRVCWDWYLVATPMFLTKIDQIEINFNLIDRTEALFNRTLSDKYQEKQRQNPSQTDIALVFRETYSDIGNMGAEDTTCLVSKYCEYIESGGTIQYTNFNFTGINFYKNEVVSRFFMMCGKHVTSLTLSDHNDYWYCDQPDKLCSKCLHPEVQNTKSVLSIFRFRTLIHTYCPNLNHLTLSKCPSKNKQDADDTVTAFPNSDESIEEESDEDSDIDQDLVEEMRYMMVFGDVSMPESDESRKIAKEMPPFNNVRTIRVMDDLVAGLFNTMFINQLFALCPRVTSASIFGKTKDAFVSRTYDFVRGLLVNTENITELFLCNLDAFIIGNLFRRHKDRLHLKLLKVNFLATHLAESYFLQFLESQSNTLEIIMCGLTQEQGPQWTYEEFCFPREMPMLIYLRIGLGERQSHIGAAQTKTFAPINWAKQFPSLKTLMLPEFATNVTIASFFEHPDPVVPLTTVTGLELPARLASKSWILVSEYHNDFPTKSEMAFRSLDELLTGFDKSQIKIATGGIRYIIGEPKHPSITNLQDAEFCNYMNLFHEDNWEYRKNFTVVCNYRGRDEAHPMCRQDTMFKDK